MNNALFILEVKTNFVFDLSTDQISIIEALNLFCVQNYSCFPDGSPIIQPQQIEVLQDTSQSSLEHYIKTQHSSQPTRFGKLLLMLSSLRKVEPTFIEQLFFAEVLRGASVADVLKKMLTGTSLAPLAPGSILA